MNKSKFIIGILIIFYLALIIESQFLYPVSGAIKFTPYLQAVTANSVYVLVETDSEKSVTVEYGILSEFDHRITTQKTEATTASPKTYVHKVKISNLMANTLYQYRIVYNKEYTQVHTFWTAAEPGTPFRFAWMADCRSGKNIHDQIAERITNAQPRFSIYGGDLCHNDSYQAFKDEFFRPNELGLIANVPFFNTVGNHEKWAQNTKAFTEGLDSASKDQGFYSFDYGDLHVLLLNSMDKSGFSVNSEYRFADRDLQASIKKWKIVVCHIPAYCAGGHGEDELMKKFTREIFEPNKVDMVISGHSHFYQHNFVNGIHHMIIGSAGAKLATPETASYTLKSVKDYNYALVDVSPASFNMTVYNNQGIILDKIQLMKP